MADENEDVKFTEEEQKAIQEDIEKARSSLVSKDTEAKITAAKEEARKEAEKEFLANQKIQELEKEREELQKQQEQKEKEAAEKLNELKSKVDELTSSKAPLRTNDPFTGKPADASDDKNVEKWDDQKVNQVEEESARAFFGPEYDRPI